MAFQQKWRRNEYLFLAGVCCLWFSLFAYVVSFFLPAFVIECDSDFSSNSGFDAFVVSMSPSLGVYFGARLLLSWLANPLLWFGFFSFAKHRFCRAFVLGLLATGLSTSLLLGDGDKSLLLVGYYLWLLSIAIFTLGAVFGWAASCRIDSLSVTPDVIVN